MKLVLFRRIELGVLWYHTLFCFAYSIIYHSIFKACKRRRQHVLLVMVWCLLAPWRLAFTRLVFFNPHGVVFILSDGDPLPLSPKDAGVHLSRFGLGFGLLGLEKVKESHVEKVGVGDGALGHGGKAVDGNGRNHQGGNSLHGECSWATTLVVWYGMMLIRLDGVGVDGGGTNGLWLVPYHMVVVHTIPERKIQLRPH